MSTAAPPAAASRQTTPCSSRTTAPMLTATPRTTQPAPSPAPVGLITGLSSALNYHVGGEGGDGGRTKNLLVDKRIISQSHSNNNE